MRFLPHTFTKIIEKFPPRKYLLFGLLFFAGYSFAANVNSDSDAIEMIVQVLNLVFTVITFLLTPAVVLAGWLLSPDWTMGDFFGLRPYFIQVWVLVSNLVYIVFALMLLWMAVMQIFSSESNYAFKKKLPRFLVGIMIVPFTWLIVSWTLSFANQAVAAVLSIPMGAISSMQTDDAKSLFHDRTIPTEFNLDFGNDAPGADPASVTCTDSGTTEDGTKCISPAEFVTYNQSGPFFIIMVYAYDIFKIQKTEMINFSQVCGGTDGATVDSRTCINSIGKLLRKFGVAFITTLFFAIILIALCWVLLARAFKLWIYVMFSPLFGLAYAVSDEGLGKTLQSEGGGSGGGASLGEVGFLPFFRLAMVPVLVSAVLSFGLLFIGVVNNTFTSGSMSETSSGTFCTSGEFMVKYCIEKDGSAEGGYNSKVIIGDDTKTDSSGKNYAITFKFGSMLSEFVANSTGATAVVGGAQGTAEAFKDIFAHIILSLIALAVMWMGVKAAVSYDEVTKKAFAPFEKFGNSVGNFVQNIPSYLPTPHPAFAAFNPATYDALATGLNTSVDSKIAESRNSLADMISGSAGKTDAAARDFKNDVGSFGGFVRQFGNNQFKDVNKAKESLLTGLNKVDQSTLSAAEKTKFADFKKAVSEAKTNDDLKNVLSTDTTTNTHANIVASLESGKIGGDIFKGQLVQLGTVLGASGGSNSSNNAQSGALPNATIEAGNTVRVGTTTIKGDSNESLPSDDQDRVKGALARANGGTSVSRLSTVENDEVARKSFDELFPTQDSKPIGEKKTIMKNLARASGIRN